jgi:hypothetical protein
MYINLLSREKEIIFACAPDICRRYTSLQNLVEKLRMSHAPRPTILHHAHSNQTPGL